MVVWRTEAGKKITVAQERRAEPHFKLVCLVLMLTFFSFEFVDGSREAQEIAFDFQSSQCFGQKEWGL